MQRKAYVTGIAALLAALLAGCTGGSQDDTPPDNANPGDPGKATAAAQPGKYRTLPEACAVVSHDSLDTLLPGIPQLTDPDQRDRAYQGTAALTFDNDRKVGCRWKVDGSGATDRLSIDFERVVSYDNTVSDDSEAEQVFAGKQTAADLPAPSASAPASSSSSSAPPASSSASSTASPSQSASQSTGAAGSSASLSSSDAATTADLQPRALDDLGDEAFVDDRLSGSGSTAQQRTVTVVFRTSNVIVTVEYDEQPTALGTVPDSEEMQDRARNLAAQLDDSLSG